MSYHIYTTNGIVLSSRPAREADRIYNILTREFGLIRATALGVRKEKSKLRGSLEPFILSRISLVRGKEYWRVTSVESLRSIPALPAIARPLVLLEKLIQGEAPNPELFDAVEGSLKNTTIYHSEGDKENDGEMFEVKLVSRILFHLGYLKESDLALEEKALVKAINEGIQASNL